MNYDVLIIGGGVIGLSLARELRRKGVAKIAVIEKGELGREASWAAAGILAPQAETDKADNFFRICAASRDMYPGFAAELLEETGVDIELDRSGLLYLAFNEKDAEELKERYQWQSAAGLPVERLNGAECRELEPLISESVREGLLFPNDWQVENRKLVPALIEYAKRSDIEILEQTAVRELNEADGKITGVTTIDGTIVSGDNVVLATGAWTSFIKAGKNGPAIDVRPIRGQMLCYRHAERSFKRVIYSARGYIVPRTDGRVLAGATVEDIGFDASTTAEGLDLLRITTREISSKLAACNEINKWAGLRPFALDGLPILGQVSEGLFVATAHYRNGILLAPWTAKTLAELIADDRSNENLRPFSPLRWPSASFVVP